MVATAATMIDYENLRTASLYINNQLLSRGLLRDGQTIEFADPSRGHGGTAMTMGRVIGVVNDLILRRDVGVDEDFYWCELRTDSCLARRRTPRVPVGDSSHPPCRDAPPNRYELQAEGAQH